MCLTLSCVSRLNGSYCYQHHHDSVSCRREARTNTAVIWWDRSLFLQARKKWPKEILSKTCSRLWMIHLQTDSFVLKLCLFTPHKPHNSVAHQQTWGWTDESSKPRGNQMKLNPEPLPTLEYWKTEAPYPQLSSHLFPYAFKSHQVRP